MADADYEIKVNGTELVTQYQDDIEEIQIDAQIGLPASCTIRMNTRDFEDTDWQGVNMTLFPLAGEITVGLGLQESSMTALFAGDIMGVNAKFGLDASVDVVCYDKLHRLRFGKQRRSFTEKKVSDVVSTIASEGGLTASTDATTTTFPYILQNNQSNYAFLMDYANRLGYDVYADETDKLYFKKPNVSASASVTLNYREDFASFGITMVPPTQGSTVEVRGWDYEKTEAFTSEVTSSISMSGTDGFATYSSVSKSETAIVHYPLVDATHGKALGEGLHSRNLLNFVQGEGVCAGLGGTSAIKIGTTVELEGIGDKFSGTYYVVGATYTYHQKRGLQTRFRVKKTGI